jgi:hypothetical protein
MVCAKNLPRTHWSHPTQPTKMQTSAQLYFCTEQTQLHVKELAKSHKLYPFQKVIQIAMKILVWEVKKGCGKSLAKGVNS